MSAQPEGERCNLVVVDTLGYWSSAQDWNDYATAAGALRPVTALAERTDAAVLLVHHDRKEGGDEVDSVSGSHAIAGNVSSVAKLSRDPELETARVVNISSRDDGQFSWHIDFNPETSMYRKTDAIERLPNNDADVLETLPVNPAHGKTVAEIKLAIDLDRDKVRRPRSNALTAPDSLPSRRKGAKGNGNAARWFANPHTAG